MIRAVLLREPWRTRLLFLSVAVNLFTIPVIAGGWLPHRHPHPSGPRSEVVIRRMARELPSGDAGRFRAAMERHVPEIETARARMDAARAAMLRTIAASSYDEESVRQAMKSWQAAWMAWSDQLELSMLAALAELSPEGRQKLAEAGLRRPPPR